MELAFSEEQTLLRSSVDRWLEREYDFAQRHASIAAPDGINPLAWARMAELGLLALPIPEASGGLGGSLIEVGLVMEALGRHLVVEPVLAVAFLAGRILAVLGDPEQKAAWLAPMMEGGTRVAFAHDEATGAIATTARKLGRKWRLDGAKHRVVGAPGAAWLLVSARDETGILRLFVVSPDTAGVTLQPQRLVDTSRAARIELSGVEVSDAVSLAGDAESVLQAATDEALIAACWEATGAMTAAYEQTVSYVKEREQFGRPLAAFQVVQHAVAEMAVACREAKAASLLAALTAGPGTLTRAASGARIKVGRCADLVGKGAVQLHGGMGVAEELPIASYFRKLLAFQATFGSASEHLARYADAVVATRLHERSAVLPGWPAAIGSGVAGRDTAS
jgi:alkylation response protein AidB-like acyl-CoA dehydrogenase